MTIKPNTTSRRALLGSLAGMAAISGLAAAVQPAEAAPAKAAGAARLTSSTLTLNDGTTLYYKDWGSGPAVVFSHGYPLSADAWEYQMLFLMQQGFRVIAFDRRGFGRSSQPAGGYDYDTFADDLAALINALNLKQVTLVGHSMGGGEVARYIGRHGEQRVAKVALVAAVTPFLLQTPDNPGGAPKALFDTFRAAVQADRSQWNKDVTMPYYSYNRAGAKVSEGVRDDYWRQGMNTGVLAAYHAITAFSETDFRADLKKITVPTLVVHGNDDQIVPFEISGKLSAQLVRNATLKVYEGGSHGLLITQKDQLNSDLLAFLRS
ncbi:non-heme chloroperoxidase [Duganella sp. 1224]|uniref:alpha/beta fold hydrolase n=1 Tax=Duganella sp. 1224 TaxID=2587052 RepID=UPI0015CCB0F3|nr:alpha/beta hydrolase [Duganella sp. 1224]NYE59434.1 non-heme chloroperoxidase [Duganella sp. 1224]